MNLAALISPLYSLFKNKNQKKTTFRYSRLNLCRSPPSSFFFFLIIIIIVRSSPQVLYFFLLSFFTVFLMGQLAVPPIPPPILFKVFLFYPPQRTRAIHFVKRSKLCAQNDLITISLDFIWLCLPNETKESFNPWLLSQQQQQHDATIFFFSFRYVAASEDASENQEETQMKRRRRKSI